MALVLQNDQPDEESTMLAKPTRGRSGMDRKDIGYKKTETQLNLLSCRDQSNSIEPKGIAWRLLVGTNYNGLIRQSERKTRQRRERDGLTGLNDLPKL